MSLFSRQVLSNSLWPHGLQHTRPPCPSLSPEFLPKFMSIESVMPSNYLILCCPFLPCLLLLFFPKLFVKPPQTTTLPSCISFPWEWSWSLPPVHCYKPLSIVLQAFCLPNVIPWIYSSPPLDSHKGFDLGHTWMALNGLMVFPTFFKLSLNFAMTSSWSESQAAPGLIFTDCIECLHFWLQRT